jgi:hypothetical protein
MARKQHQEEISGPVDLTQAAPLAKDLARPKRARILSRKALENRVQNQSTQVSSSAPAVPTVPIPTTAKSAPVDDSSPAGIDTSTSKQRPPPKAQNSSKRKRENGRDSEKEEEWERQYKSTQKKADKLKILLEHIGPVRPYPEKLKIPTPIDHGRPFPRIPFVFDPLELFHRFIPQKRFDTIARNTNEYAGQEGAQNSRLKTQWRDVTSRNRSILRRDALNWSSTGW